MSLRSEKINGKFIFQTKAAAHFSYFLSSCQSALDSFTAKFAGVFAAKQKSKNIPSPSLQQKPNQNS
jgi:hypothetical protein